MTQPIDNDITVDRRLYVLELQGYLRALQRAETGSTNVPQDGYYGADTADAVRVFQIQNGLPSTGAADAATWEALRHAYTMVVTDAQPPITVKAKGSAPLTKGDRGDPVLFLNAMLARLGRVYDNLPSLTVDDRYTDDTVRGIKEIQQWADLPPTGQTDTPTWDTVATLYNQLPQEALFE